MSGSASTEPGARPPRTYVVVHGVGRAEPGSVGEAVGGVLLLGTTEKRHLRHEGEDFLEYRSLETGDAILEMNWSDVLRPQARLRDLLKFVSYLITSLVDIAAAPVHRYSTIRLYRLSLFTLTPGALLLMTSTMVAASIPDQATRVVAGVLTTLAAAGLVLWLSRLGSYFACLWPWVVGMGVVVALAPGETALPINGWTIDTAGAARLVTFVLTIILLNLAVVESLMRSRNRGRDARAAELAMLYLPFVAINILMTWFTYLSMVFASRTMPGFDNWEVVLRPQVDWASIEWVATLTIGGVGALAVLLPLSGYLRTADKRGEDETNRRGRAAQDGVGRFLLIAPLLLFGLGLFTFIMSGQTTETPQSIIDVYEKSIWRALPYTAWFAGPFALFLDALGDVVFYARPQDEGHPAAIRRTCDARMKAALGLALQSDGDVVVVAHSQGSVIAANTLGDLSHERVGLVTLGSPLEALYRRFLERAPAKMALRWVNAYRDGDYIAGPISTDAVSNVNIGPGGHTDYWSEPILAELVERVTSRPAAHRGS